MTIGADLQDFADRLLPMLPADFAAPVRALDLAAAAAKQGRLPVCRFWPTVTAGASPLLAPLVNLAPALGWIQNPNYVARPPDPDFLENYGYAVLAGPGGLVESETLALGLLLLGPRTHYPTHRHPAVEGRRIALDRTFLRLTPAPCAPVVRGQWSVSKLIFHDHRPLITLSNTSGRD